MPPAPLAPLAPPPPHLALTREAMHAVAEWVLAPARHAATGRIGLQVTPGGFGTPEFGEPVPVQVRVEGTELVVRRRAAVDRAPLTTLGAAAAFAAVPPGRPTGAYPPVTGWDADRPLPIEPTAARVLAEWFAFTADVLSTVRAELAGTEPSEIQLWPEHFDIAFSAAEANYGGSPGDADHPLPYLYVGPWAADRRPGPGGEYWNEPFGASLSYTALRAAGDGARAAALTFFRTGATALR